jgi:hypothetical protein
VQRLPRVLSRSDFAILSLFSSRVLPAAALIFAVPRLLAFFRVPVPRGFPTTACLCLANPICPPIPSHRSTVLRTSPWKGKGVIPFENHPCIRRIGVSGAANAQRLLLCEKAALHSSSRLRINSENALNASEVCPTEAIPP